MKTQLLEKSRADLLRQSKVADVTKSYGTTRYERRNKQHVYNLVANFNRIDFNALFKANLLSFIIPIHGETDDYNITVLFEGICDDIQREIKANQYKLEYKCVYRALIKAINNQDIYISCDCPDWKYRMQYWSTKDRYNAGQSQIVPARVTNPDNSKGAGCKHVLKVLSNLD